MKIILLVLLQVIFLSIAGDKVEKEDSFYDYDWSSYEQELNHYRTIRTRNFIVRAATILSVVNFIYLIYCIGGLLWI